MSGELIKADKVLKVGQRVEFYLEKDEQKYTSRIEDMTDDELIVAMPMDAKRRPVIPMSGERLYGLAVGQQCRYRFFTVYHDKASMPIPVWRILRPEMVERHQNRAFVRVRVSLPLKVQIVDEDGKLGSCVLTRTVDLSGNGVGFVLPQPAAINHQVALEFNNLPDIGTLKIMSRIARCLPMDSQNLDRGYQIGVHFLDLPRAIANKLIRYIFVLQRENLAKGINL